MGALLQKLLGGGPLLQLDHVECCNDEVRSSSSSDSWRTHASGHVETARDDHGAKNASGRDHENEVAHAVRDLPSTTQTTTRAPRPPMPWASPAASLAGR